jgi:two-component system, probable response regulator PhcQ
MKRLLIIDDDPAVLAALRRVLRRGTAGGLHIDTETDPLRALGLTRERHYDVVVSDLKMPELDGVALLSLVGVVQPDAVRLLLTGSDDIGDAQRAISEAGVFRYLRKPWSDDELVAQVKAALAQAETQARAFA